MELNEQNFKTLAQFLQHTLSPNPVERRPAEKFLEGVEVNEGYSLLLLNLVDKDGVDMTIRVAGAITFKNYVKRNWGAHLDNDTPDKITEADRNVIKTLIVALMLKSTPAIQKQLSDAVSIIGKYDFPEKWPQLIDEMVEKFATGDFNIINGILQTAHSLFKRYRYEFKSQKLWEEIKLVLDKFARPLTDLLCATMGLAKQHSGNETALRVIYSSLGLICKVFYSLNSQDLPEFFEDNMNTWMSAFLELIAADVACLQTGDDDESGVLEHLRSQICDNLCLYAQKYDEEFQPYMQQFVTVVWELLTKTGNQTKYDALVSSALQFLSIVAERNHYRSLFEERSVLVSICEKVIIPNMDFRTSDEELFEDNPEEYIRRDIEGSDTETRRRAACDLVKTLAANFEGPVMEIFGGYLNILTAKYAENPKQNWRAKDTAMYLVTSLAARGKTEKLGVTQTSALVPIPMFCQQQIIPELERANVNELPVLKADAIKFIMTFRSLLGQQIIMSSLPLIIRHLSTESGVVHSYAATTIDKILLLRDSNNQPIVPKEQLTTFSQELLNGLFNVLNMPGSNENEYVMKAIMRSFVNLQEGSMPFMGVALPQLTQILSMVSKNPSRPHFNHYLFETLSLSIKIVCKVQPQAVGSFEEALFPVFQNILQQDILEFLPYVFQMLSLLLELRGGDIPEPYWALFPCLLSPTLWDRSGNVTPLIRLICAFVRGGSSKISADGKMNAVLGVFQKMIASKVNDHEGFILLQALILHYPREELMQNMKQIFAILFQRLSLSKTAKYIKNLIVFFCFYAGKVGASQLVELIDSIQAQMFGMVMERVFVPDMTKVTDEFDRKIIAIGTTKLLCDCPPLFQPPYNTFWPKILQGLIQVFELPPDETNNDDDTFVELDDGGGYQVAYSKLIYAQNKPIDAFADIGDARKTFIENLAQVSRMKPGEIPTMLSSLHPDYQQALQKYCAQAGVQIQ